MRRALVALLVVLAIAVPRSARASVDQASFSAQIYPAAVGSVVAVTATIYGFNGQGDAQPMIVVPNELSAQSSSSCYAQTGNASSPQAEVTPCYLTQSPHIGGEAMAVTVNLPELGLYQRYGVAVTLMVLVTDAATPGETYPIQIPGSLNGGGSLLPSGVYAGIQVLPPENMSGGGEAAPQTNGSTTTSTAWLNIYPRAVRLAPKGQVDVLIQPLVNTQGTMPDLSVTIIIPPSVKILDGPWCVAPSATLSERRQCSDPVTTASAGATTLTISPRSSGGRMDAIVLTVSPSGKQTSDFAQISATVHADDESVSISQGIAYINVDFAAAESIISTSHPASRWVLLELTHDFAVNGSFCWASQLTQTPDLTLQLWGDGNNVVDLSRQSGFVGESTSDGQYQSCYIPYVSPSLPEGNLYVVKVGTCLRCGVGLLPMSSGADQVIPDYILFPEPRPSQRGGNSSPERSGADLATIIYGRTFADYVTNTLPRLSSASVGSEVSANSQHQ